MLAPNGWSYITVWIVAIFLLNSFTLQLVNLTLNHCPPHSHTRRLLQSSFKARLNAPCAAVALLSHMLPQTLSWGAVGHSLPFTRCELNCSPCGLPGLQLKTSTTFPLCAASFQKTTSLWHVWTPRREAFFHLPFCPQAFCKDVRTNLGLSVHRRKGRALKTAASGDCRYPDQGERRSIICHCLLHPRSLPKKVEGGGKKGLKVWQRQPPTTGGSGSESQSDLRKGFEQRRWLNHGGAAAVVPSVLACLCLCIITRAVWQKGSDLNISNKTFRYSFLSAFLFLFLFLVHITV